MADNITAPAVGLVLATDDIGGVHYPRTKISVGADGAAADVSAANPLPVSLDTAALTALETTELGATTLAALENIGIASSVLPTGAATAAKQDALIAAIEAMAPGGGSGGDASAANQDEQTALLTTINAALVSPVTVDGTVELGATSLAALETTELGASTLAALETIELGATSLAALENVTTTVTGVATEASLATIIGHVDTLETLQGSVTETAPATDTASSGINGRLQRIAQRLTSLIALVPASLGSKAAAASFATTMSTEDLARFGTLTETAPASDTASSGLNGRLQRIAQRLTSLITSVDGLTGNEYETVAASQTNQALGATGATGDLLVSVLIVPASTTPGAVTIKDGSGAAITIFPGGVSSVSTLHPFSVPLMLKSASGAWQITTGANVSAIATGNFT